MFSYGLQHRQYQKNKSTKYYPKACWETLRRNPKEKNEPARKNLDEVRPNVEEHVESW